MKERERGSEGERERGSEGERGGVKEKERGGREGGRMWGGEIVKEGEKERGGMLY